MVKKYKVLDHSLQILEDQISWDLESFGDFCVSNLESIMYEKIKGFVIKLIYIKACIIEVIFNLYKGSLRRQCLASWPHMPHSKSTSSS